MEDINLDYMSAIIDEIALEGLDGITISTFWKRLNLRPKFPIAIDNESKIFIWECLALHEAIDFYELPEPRTTLTIFDRYSHVDTETNLVSEPDVEFKDPYPFEPVEDKNIRGSCKTYKDRVCVTSQIRENGLLLTSLYSAWNKWAESLVAVASQHTRQLAIFGPEVAPNISLTSMNYAILERIARARYHGEVTQGKFSLAVCGISPKTMFYYLKKLRLKGLIVKQNHFYKAKESFLSKAVLLHIKRFYVERKSKVEIMIKNMCNILETKPSCQEAFVKLREELGMTNSSFKKMFCKIFKNCVQVKVITYAEMYPDEPPESGLTSQGKEKVLKVVQLLQSYQEDQEEEIEEEDTTQTDDNELMFNPGKICIDRPMMSQTYKAIEEGGPEGVGSLDLEKSLGLPRLEIRTLVRGLLKRNAVMMVMQDKGKQRTKRYIAKRFEYESEAHQQVVELTQKLINHSSMIEFPSPEPEDVSEILQEVSDPTNADFSIEKEVQEVSDISLEETGKKKGILNVPDIKVSIIENTEPAKQPREWSFTVPDSLLDKNATSYQMPTYKTLKRANRIIEIVRELKVICGFSKLSKIVNEEEKSQGLIERMDVKSTKRIVDRLVKDGYLKNITTLLQDENKSKKVTFICDSSMSPKDPLLRKAIEKAKLLYFRCGMPMPKPLPHKAEVKLNISFVSNLCKQYGYLPKFPRIKTLHEFLIYILYDYKGSITPLSGFESEESQVYMDVNNWRRYVPPLQTDQERGWCWMSDLLLRLPLSLLLKIHAVNYEIPGLKEYMEIGNNRHQLINCLPPNLRDYIYHNRKYIFSLSDVLHKMAYLGLLSLGPNLGKEKETIQFYLHFNVSYRDTTSSPAGYAYITPGDYPLCEYQLDTLDDWLTYWTELEKIAYQTQLGSYIHGKGQIYTCIDSHYKPELMETVQPKNPEDIIDDGSIPGDGLGAAGFDSSLFVHLKRNWNEISASNYNRTSKLSIENPKPKTASSGTEKRLASLRNKMEANKIVQSLADKKEAVISVQSSTSSKSTEPKMIRSRKVRTRIIGRAAVKKRKPYYDEKDKQAIKKMTQMRVTWTVEEDTFLLFCKVASSFLDPISRGMVVPYSCIRDLLYKRLPTVSVNKTSRACQRRTIYMLKNPSTLLNVSVYLGEANQDPELSSLFRGPKPARTNLKVWKEMFQTVVEHLIDKYLPSSVTEKPSSEPSPLPLSYQEFQETFRIKVCGKISVQESLHTDPKNISDIQSGVIFNLIFEALFSAEDPKSNWSFILYKMYNQYPDTLIRSVIQRLRREGSITLSKSKRQTSLSNLFTTVPHKVSQRYFNLLNGRYQKAMYETILCSYKKLAAAQVKEEEVVYSNSVNPGCVATFLTLQAQDKVTVEVEIPDDIIVFYSNEYQNEKMRLEDFMETNAEGFNSRKASRFALYAIRHHLNDTILPIQQEKGEFGISSCKVRLTASILDEGTVLPPVVAPAELNMIIHSLKKSYEEQIFEKSNIDEIVNDLKGLDFSDEDSEVGAHIYKYLLQGKEFGYTLEQLWTFFSSKCSSLDDLLESLVRLGHVLRVGFVCYRFVAGVFSQPWILNSIKVPREKKHLAANYRSEIEDETNPTQRDLTKRSPITKRQRSSLNKSKSKKTIDSDERGAKKRKGSIDFEVLQCLNQSILDQIPESTLLDKDPLFDGSQYSKLLVSEVAECLEDSVLKKVCESSNQESKKRQREGEPPCSSKRSKNKPAEEFPLKEWFQASVLDRVEIFQEVGDLLENQILKPVCESPKEGSSTVTLTTRLKSRLEEKVMIEIEALHQAAQAQDQSAVTTVTQWLLKSILKKLEQGCSLGDITVWFQQSILAKIQDKSASETLNRWFQDSIISKIEDQSLIVDLKGSTSTETSENEPELPKNISDEPNINISMDSLIKWFQESILNLVEMQTSKEELKSWFHKTVLLKVEEFNLAHEIQSWFEEKILNHSSLQFSNADFTGQLFQQKYQERLEEECSKKVLEDWFVRKILDEVERKLTTEEIKTWFQNTVMSKIEELCSADNMRIWFESEVLSKIDGILHFKALKNWFQLSFMEKVDRECASAKLDAWFREREISHDSIKSWYQENLLKKVEEECQSHKFKIWFQERILDKVSTEADFDLRHWLTENLNKVEDSRVDDLAIWLKENVIDKVEAGFLSEGATIKASPNQELQDWFEKRVINQLEQQEISTWFQEKVLNVIDDLPAYKKERYDYLELRNWLEKEVLTKLDDLVEIKEFLDTVVLPEVEINIEVSETINESLLGKVDISDTSPKSLAEAEVFDVSKWFKTNLLDKLRGEDSSKVRKWMEDITKLKNPSVEVTLDRALSSFEGDSRNAEEMKAWFEKSISSNLNKVKMEKEPVPAASTPVIRKSSRIRPPAREKRTSLTQESDLWAKIRYVGRIWKKPDGGLNASKLHELLVAVLGVIATQNGIKQEDLFKKLDMCLQPVQILELLELLQEIDCVEVIYLKRSHKPGFFKPVAAYSILEGYQPGVQVMYEAKLCCFTNLSRFLEQPLVHQHV